MPPNINVRSRFELEYEKPVSSQATTKFESKVRKIELDEVVIDGGVYKIDSFNHPGGDSVRMFGGNDVTAQYKMMHPYHSERQLEKMKKVGTMSDWKTEFIYDSEFAQELKIEVAKVVKIGQEFGTTGFWFRLCFYVTIFVTLQYIWVVKGSSILMAIVLGVSQASIGLNVQHDANHGALSKDPKWNDMFGFGASLIGGDKWTWMEQHTTHHAYTNHVDKDPDAVGAEPFVLFNKYDEGHPTRKSYHGLQAFYYIPMLSFYWLSSVFNPQVFDLKQTGALKAGMEMENEFIISRRKYAVLIRIFYIYCNVVCPFKFHAPLTAIWHFMLMGFTSSLTLAIPFSLSHNFINADRDPTEEARKSGKGVCWYRAQVESSCTYGAHISGYLTGGLNFQIEHHCFPRMSSAWYPYIMPTVKRVCKKHGVRYSYYPWFLQNLYSTVKYMHLTGHGLDAHDNPFTGNM